MKPKDFIKKNIFPDLLAAFLFITPFIFELYYEFSSYLAGDLCIYFVYLIHHRKSIFSFDLKFIKKSANPLAYKISEKPTIYLSNTVLQY